MKMKVKEDQNESDNQAIIFLGVHSMDERSEEQKNPEASRWLSKSKDIKILDFWS